MTLANLEKFSSYVREIDGECTFVRIANGFLFSGSKNGQIACWDIYSGIERWRFDFEGPCTDSDFNEEFLFFSESENIHAIRIDSGELFWSVRLEGSSDLVRISDDYVWVTSSVYNFEIQDYSEGSVWQIDFDGNVRNVCSTQGRAWSLSSQEDKLLIGLSRPISGYAIISNNGIEYPELENRQPVTIGNEGRGDTVVLGHGNGMITEIVNHEVQSTSNVGGAVRAIDYFDGWVAGVDSGLVSSSQSLGSWSVDLGGVIDVLRFGPSFESRKLIWAPSWRDGESAVVSLLDSNSGDVEMEVSHHSRIGCASANEEIICFGDISGCINVIEGEVFRRRFFQPTEEIGNEDKAMEMRRKIRRLRGG